jgi:hypothetical protein
LTCGGRSWFDTLVALSLGEWIGLHGEFGAEETEGYHVLPAILLSHINLTSGPIIIIIRRELLNRVKLDTM